jgi:hypothetical protein
MMDMPMKNMLAATSILVGLCATGVAGADSKGGKVNSAAKGSAAAAPAAVRKLPTSATSAGPSEKVSVDAATESETDGEVKEKVDASAPTIPGGGEPVESTQSPSAFAVPVVQPTVSPEVDPGTLGSALTLLAGGLLVLRGRKQV